MAQWFRRNSGAEVPKPKLPTVGPVHSLADNFQLSQEQHSYCVGLIEGIQKLYDGSVRYADHAGLDRDLVLPGNEWAQIVPVTGIKFRTSYDDVNYLRLSAPFAGYHLLVLDRLDVRKFPDPLADDLLATCGRDGIPPNIVSLLADRYDPRQRLHPVVDEYVAHIRNVPKRYIVRTPRQFGELGIEVNGLLVNPDVTLCQSRINGLLSAGILDKLDTDIARRGRARVLEIGPGYGPLALALKNIYGDALEYVCVDLPSSLYYSTIYLSITANGEGCHLLMPGDKVPDRFNYLFVANYLLDEFTESLGAFDLALNTMSFSEMSIEQVRYYGELFKRLLRPDGVAFDENAAPGPHHVDNKAIFDKIFPLRKRITSDAIVTKNWCQDVWAKQYVAQVFDCSDSALLNRDFRV